MSDVTEYFSDRADAYERYRPTYPGEALAWALEGLPRPAQVADVGCGTGIATRLLAALGAEVVGVEPNDAMRARAEAVGAEGTRFVAGVAEATGLPDGAFDLVVCAQAFHWFDGPAALEEFHRVLRPGGRLALVWNVRQDDVGFGAPYAAAVARAKVHARGRGRLVRSQRVGDPSQSPWFTDPRLRSFANDQSLSWDEVVGRSRSASYFPPPGPLEDELLAGLHAAFRAHAREGRVVLPQRTEVTCCARVDAP